MDDVVEIDLVEYNEGPQSFWEVFTSIGYEPTGLLNLVLLVGIFVLAKFVFRSFIMSEKRGKKTKKDNFAYAISAFSLFISLALILTSVIYGDVATSYEEAILKTLKYAGLGILLLVISGYIFDKIAFSEFNLNREIAEGNESAAIVDASNFFGSALIVSAALMWQEFKGIDAMMYVMLVYLVSQVILTLATFVRISIFNKPEKSIKLQQQIVKNNTAVAIDFAGRRIGTAFAITAATNLLAFHDDYTVWEIIIDWAVVAVILVLALNIFSWITSKIIFWGKDIYADILNGNNSSALGDAAIYVSLGYILAKTIF